MSFRNEQIFVASFVITIIAGLASLEGLGFVLVATFITSFIFLKRFSEIVKEADKK